jgi:hypothetical protein
VTATPTWLAARCGALAIENQMAFIEASWMESLRRVAEMNKRIAARKAARE